MLSLYHGSNTEVITPKLLEKTRALDFGSGFYLTTSLNQATQWAKLVHKRKRNGKAIVNYYALNETYSNTLNILHFDIANGDWLDFVVNNRKGLMLENSYDLVIGPVANDSTLPVIDDYMDGRYTKEEAIKRLMPQNLTNQYAFLSEKALSMLSFVKSEAV